MPKGRFSEKVVTKVAQRACYHCSYCRNLTAGPHTDPDKATITGEAAHIRAANPGGPRYDTNQTDEERHGASNAIWLCCNCHKKVDTDWKDWPAQKLIDIKRTHEDWLAKEEIIPKLPDITVTTKSGLSALPGVTVTGEDCQKYREHSLVIQNPNRIELQNLQASVQLPERAAATRIDAPPGIACRFLPKPSSMQSVIKGKGSVTVPPQQPSSLCQLGIDRLPAQTQIEVVFWTIPPRPTEEGPSPGLWDGMFVDPEVISHFINGTFQFMVRNEYLTRTFFARLVGDTEKRTVIAEPVRESPAPKRIAKASGHNI